MQRWAGLVWARLLREAASELLPFTQIGGFVVGARAATLQGVDTAMAFGSTLVDVTAELIAQLGFTGLGITILATRAGGGHGGRNLLGGAVVGLLLTAVGAAGFIALQRHGMGFVEALARRLLPRAAAGAGELRQALAALYQRPARLAISVLLHLLSWIASALGAWFALELAGVHIDVASVLAIESLVFAVRSATFFAPMGVGVQEATYALIGPLFGLGADLSLALSLLKRARELAIGVPALWIWQSLEGRRLVVGSHARRSSVRQAEGDEGVL